MRLMKLEVVLVLTLLLSAALPAQARPGRRSLRASARPGVRVARQPARGVWVKSDRGRIRKISLGQFQRKFGVKWARLQQLGKGLTEKTLPGYSDGPGTFDINNLDAPQYVAPQYKPTRADRRAINGHTARVYVGQVNKDVGHGLFARGRIPAGSVIGEYTGVVRNENRATDRANGYTFTYDPFNQLYMLVDAQKQGNYMRFANHSAKYANAKPRLVYDEPHRRWHVLLVATKEIPRGDQVLFNYGHQYGWDRFGIQQPADLKPR